MDDKEKKELANRRYWLILEFASSVVLFLCLCLLAFTYFLIE